MPLGYVYVLRVMFLYARILFLRGGFNSSADTHAKNKSPFWMGPISGVLSNSNGTIMVLCSDFLSSAFASIVFDSNSPLIIVTTLRSFTSFLSERRIQTLIVGFFISGPSTVWKDQLTKSSFLQNQYLWYFLHLFFQYFPQRRISFHLICAIKGISAGKIFIPVTYTNNVIFFIEFK